MFHFENVFLLCCRNGKISMRNFFILRSIVISSAFSLFSSFSLSLSCPDTHSNKIGPRLRRLIAADWFNKIALSSFPSILTQISISIKKLTHRIFSFPSQLRLFFKARAFRKEKKLTMSLLRGFEFWPTPLQRTSNFGSSPPSSSFINT